MFESLVLMFVAWYLCGFCMFVHLGVELPESRLKAMWWLTIWPIVLAKLDK